MPILQILRFAQKAVYLCGLKYTQKAQVSSG